MIPPFLPTPCATGQEVADDEQELEVLVRRSLLPSHVFGLKSQKIECFIFFIKWAVFQSHWLYCCCSFCKAISQKQRQRVVEIQTTDLWSWPFNQLCHFQNVMFFKSVSNFLGTCSHKSLVKFYV